MTFNRTLTFKVCNIQLIILTYKFLTNFFTFFLFCIFVVLKSTSMEDKMNLNEFEDAFWMYVPEDLISNEDIEKNRDFCETIVEKMWRSYSVSNVAHDFIFYGALQLIKAFVKYKPKF